MLLKNSLDRLGLRLIVVFRPCSMGVDVINIPYGKPGIRGALSMARAAPSPSGAGAVMW